MRGYVRSAFLRSSQSAGRLEVAAFYVLWRAHAMRAVRYSRSVLETVQRMCSARDFPLVRDSPRKCGQFGVRRECCLGDCIFTRRPSVSSRASESIVLKMKQATLLFAVDAAVKTRPSMWASPHR
jgi:hypothetical protein